MKMLPQKAALIRLCPGLGLGRMKGRPASNARTFDPVIRRTSLYGFLNFRKPDGTTLRVLFYTKEWILIGEG
jgi:hypothetical protein